MPFPYRGGLWYYEGPELGTGPYPSIVEPSQNPLRKPVSYGLLDDVTAVLRRHRDEWEEHINDALSDAIWKSNAPLVDILLSHGACLTEPAFFGIRDVGVVEQLVSHGFDVNSREFRGEPMLRMAAHKPEVARWLLDHGADPNIYSLEGVSPMATAAVSAGFSFIDTLLAYGAEIQPDILHYALRPRAARSPEMVQYLISKGAGLEFDHEAHGPPLHYAASLGRKAQVKILLEAGADATRVVKGYTAADVAKKRGYMEVYELLFSSVKEQVSVA